MADHYLDPGAAGGGDGSITYPWNSLTQLNAHSFVAGDNVYFKKSTRVRGAVSIDFSGSALGGYVTFGAYGSGDRPIISGAVEVNTAWVHDETDPTNVYHVHDIRAKYSSYGYEIFAVIFDDIAGRWRDGIYALTTNKDWWWDESTEKLYVYCTSSPDYEYSSVEYSYEQNIFYTGWADPRHYIKFQNLHVYGSNSSGAFFGMWSNNWVFDDVVVNNNPRIAIQMYGCAYHTVQNCTLTGIRVQPIEMRAIYYTGAHNASYPGHHNTFYNNVINNWTGYGIDHAGYDHYSAPSHDVLVHYNDVSGCGTGVYIGMSDGNIEVHHNTCDDNLRGPYPVEGTFEEYGLAISGVSNARFHHNTCTNGRVGAEVWNFEGEGDPQWYQYRHAYNIEMDHNLFAGNTEHGWMIYTGSTSGIDLHDNIMRNNYWAGIYIVEDDQPGTGNLVYNNTVFNNNDSGIYGNIYLGSGLSGWTRSSNIVWDTNQYLVRSGSTPSDTHRYNCYYRASGTCISLGSTSYNLAQTKSTYEPTCINEDPKFVSTVTPDLHLQSDSPCIDAAEELGRTTDYDDNPIV